MDESAPQEDTSIPNENPIPQQPVEAPPPPPANPLKKVMLIVFLITLMLLGSAAGFYFGTRQIPQKEPDNTNNQTKSDGSQTDPTHTPQYPLPTPAPCLPGFTFYENDYFALCYPQSMDFNENFVNTDTQVGIEVVFADDIEILRVQSNYVGNLDKYDCVSNRVVRVSGYQATRNTIKEVSSAGKCQKTILRYATLISMGHGESVYYLGLSKKEGTYIPESLKFNFIEQSFKIKK
jgi:hypothetical protein